MPRPEKEQQRGQPDAGPDPGGDDRGDQHDGAHQQDDVDVYLDHAHPSWPDAVLNGEAPSGSDGASLAVGGGSGVRGGFHLTGCRVCGWWIRLCSVDPAAPEPSLRSPPRTPLNLHE